MNVDVTLSLGGRTFAVSLVDRFQVAVVALPASRAADDAVGGLDEDAVEDLIDAHGFATVVQLETVNEALAALIADEVDDRAAAIDAEAAARAAAIATEAATRAAQDALLIPLTQKAAANGVATLGSDGVIPTSQLPAIATVERRLVANQAARLALTNVQPGDVAVQADNAETSLLIDTDQALAASWKAIDHTAVASVNGQVGTVVLGPADVGADAAGAAAAAQAAAIAASQPRSSVLTTYAGITPSANVQSLLAAATFAAFRALLSLGTAALVDTGTGAGNAVLGNDARLSDARTPADASVTSAKLAAALLSAFPATAFSGAVTVQAPAASAAPARLDTVESVSPRRVSGKWYQQECFTASNTAAISANTMRAVPFLVRRRLSIARLGISVQTGVAATDCRIAVYADDGTFAYPGALVVETGALATTGSAVLVDAAAVCGVFDVGALIWLVMKNGATGGVTFRGTNDQNPHLEAPQGTLTPWTALTVAGPAGAMPANFTAGAVLSSATTPLIKFQVA